MTEIVMEAHRRKIPIDHPDRSITRDKLEYPTEDVSLVYLTAIDKVRLVTAGTDHSGIETLDSFTDKAVEGYVYDEKYLLTGRSDGAPDSNLYQLVISSPQSTADFGLSKFTNGSFSWITRESVDLSSGYFAPCKLSISGSTLKGYREDLTTPKITATDTDHASGYFGIRAGWKQPIVLPMSCWLRPPSSPVPLAKVIVEVGIIGSGTVDDPFRPNLAQSLKKITELTGLPYFLYQEAKKYEILRNKGFTDEEIKALFGSIPQHQVDLASVTWGAFDHKETHATMLIIITSDNQYKEGAIQKQIEHAKAKSLKVLSSPRDYNEAIEQYRKLKADFPHWIAGKDNWAYQTLGHEIFELFQVADTYHGNIVEGYKPNAYKKVPDLVMRKTLSMWKERLKKVSALVEERDKHLKKLEKVEKIGW